MQDSRSPCLEQGMAVSPRQGLCGVGGGVFSRFCGQCLNIGATDQLAAVDLVRRLPARPGEPSGPEVVGLPICFDRKRPHSPRSAPKLGEHTDEVLGRS